MCTGRESYALSRQMTDHSTFLLPVNAFMWVFLGFVLNEGLFLQK